MNELSAIEKARDDNGQGGVKVNMCVVTLYLKGIKVGDEDDDDDDH